MYSQARECYCRLNGEERCQGYGEIHSYPLIGTHALLANHNHIARHRLNLFAIFKPPNSCGYSRVSSSFPKDSAPTSYPPHSLSDAMNPFKKKNKIPQSDATSPSTGSTSSLSVPDHLGIRRRVKSWAETLLTPTKQPPSIVTTPTPSIIEPRSTSAPPDEASSPTPNPTFPEDGKDAIPETIPVVEKDSPKTTAWNAFRTALSVTKEIADVTPFTQLGGILGGLITVLDKFEVRPQSLSGSSYSIANARLAKGGRW